MALQKYVPLGSAPAVGMKPLRFLSKVHENAQVVDPETCQIMESDVDIDISEVYFLIMHFLSSGPCLKTYGQFWNELLEYQLLPRRYHAWYSRSGVCSGYEDDSGLSFPLNYDKLVERYPHIEKNHLVKLLKQLLLNSASPPQGMKGGNSLNAAAGPTLLGTGTFSLLRHDRDQVKNQVKSPPAHMRWPHMHANQIRGLSLREIGGGFTRHHRAPSIHAACYAIAKPSTMVQKMQNIKRLRGHRNAVYCAIFDCSGRYVVTGSDDRLVKIWSMETAFCLASCRGHEGDITDLAVSSNNTLVASASNDCAIRVWHLPDGLPISVLCGHTAAVTAIAFSPRPGSAYQLLSSSDDGTCRIWDARNSHFIPRMYVPRPSDSLSGRNSGPSTSSSVQSHQIFCCAFNASGTVFVTGSADNLARVWNACRPNPDDSDQPNHEIDVLSGHENDVNYVQFSGCAVASRFSLTDSPREENIPKFRNSWFSHDNIVTCSRDGSAIIWIPRSRKSHGKVGRWTRAYHLKVPPPPMPPQPPHGGPRQRILPTPRGVNMIVWSLDNRFVLAAIMDCRICVWNAADGSLVHSLTGHTDSTYVLDVHPFNPRIAMSAGYDGKTIIWDIWEGVPIQVYEISRFELVDGKFSPDGTSIILSDNVGQLYILNTGQGESQKDAKYDQFFLGDYRPLVQDTFGNVLDQETQLIPYRRNMQDLLCDSGMIPYPEDYQNMYQKRRLGALGMEWRPPSIRLTVGPDFNLDPDYQMLPLADLDVLVEPLPEFVDTMDWEPEIEVQSDDNDSEYNVTEEYSSGGKQGSLNSSSFGDPDCSAEESDVEGKDEFRRSKRKKQKAEIEFLSSSGRHVKKRNLDECDSNSLRSNRIRKSRMGGNASKKSSSFKTLRPQRAAARNALTLFTKITGSATDGEDEDDSEGDLSESESTLQGSNIESAKSDRSLQNELNRHSKGKEAPLEEIDSFVGSCELPGVHMDAENRQRLVLKLPVRNYKKFSLPENTQNPHDKSISLADSSFRSPQDTAEGNRMHTGPLDSGLCSYDANGLAMEGNSKGQVDRFHLNLSQGYKNGDIRWGGVKARTSKCQRVQEAISLAPHTRYGACFADHGEENNLNRHLKTSNDQGAVFHGSEIQKSTNKMGEDAQFNAKDIGTRRSEAVVDVAKGMVQPDSDVCMDADEMQERLRVTEENDYPPELEENFTPVSKKFRIKSNKISRVSVDNLGNGTCDLLPDCLTDMKLNPVSGEEEHDKTNNVSPNNKGDGLHNVESQIDGSSKPTLDDSSHPKKMYNVVYRRLRSSRNKPGLECNGNTRESLLYANNHDLNGREDFYEDKIDEGCRTSFGGLTTANEANIVSSNMKLSQQDESEDMFENLHNDSVNPHQHPWEEEEWGSSSRMVAGLRSTRNRRTNYCFHDAGPVDQKKLHQSPKIGSWLMLSMHEISRYIPQLGDRVVYLRQGHQEYINHRALKEAGPWKLYKGNVRAVEFCEVVELEYSTLAGSGESCCKMTLKFIDPNSSLFPKSFRLTLPEVTGFPDFLVERTRYDAAMQRNWTNRDKCRVWWKNEDEQDGSWWDGRVTSVQPKSPKFPDSPWESCTVKYKSNPTETELHSPWELFDADTQWEQPRIDDETRDKLLSAAAKLDKSARKAQDYYGVQKLRQVSQKSNFINRFPVPLSLEVIQLRLENYYYRSLSAVKHDIKVMLANAESYFGKNAELSTKMKRLSDFLTRTLSSL